MRLFKVRLSLQSFQTKKQFSWKWRFVRNYFVYSWRHTLKTILLWHTHTHVQRSQWWISHCTMMNSLWMEYTVYPDHEIWTSGMRVLPRPSLTEQIIAFTKRDSAAKHLKYTWQQTRINHQACTLRCFHVHYLHFNIHHVSVYHG